MGRGRLPYALFQKRGRRGVRVGLHEELGVVVVGPLGISPKRVRRMLRKNYGGLSRALRRELQEVAWLRPRTFEDGERFLYLGRWYRLEVREIDQDTALPPVASASLHHGRMRVHVRPEWRPRTRARRIREQIGEFYGLQTGMHLLARVEGWARALRVATPQLWMTRLGDAWAGCVPEQSLLVFDDRVIQAPLRVLDYVIVHELAHFYHRGHSTKFWSRVARVLPDHKKRDDELRRLEPAMRW